MSTESAEDPTPPSAASHEARPMAESFGIDAEGYDRARPRYPQDLVRRILDGSPGPVVLDVGCGTGIAARQLQAVGCTVLGVEPDTRMAEFARAQGVPVEVATFEAWQPVGRTFDAVVAAQSWHWVDPEVGALKAAEVLRPDGRLAIFGHLFEPPLEVAEPYAAAFRRLAPDSPFKDLPARRPVETYLRAYGQVADRIRDSARFEEPEQWRFDWEQSYTRDEWLALLPTTGALTQLRGDQIAGILAPVGRAIDELGGSFTMEYVTLAVSAVRRIA